MQQLDSRSMWAVNQFRRSAFAFVQFICNEHFFATAKSECDKHWFLTADLWAFKMALRGNLCCNREKDSKKCKSLMPLWGSTSTSFDDVYRSEITQCSNLQILQSSFSNFKRRRGFNVRFFFQRVGSSGSRSVLQKSTLEWALFSLRGFHTLKHLDGSTVETVEELQTFTRILTPQA